jgi:TRAP-type C4-dicarboxylate transport system permease small subunit
MIAVLARGEAGLAKVLLAVITLLVFVAGITRWFNLPLVWSVDLAQLLFIWLCFLGANEVMRRRAHIGVDYFVRRLPRRRRAGVEIVLAVLVLAFLVTMIVTGTRLTLLNWQRVYGDSGLSYAWVTGAVPVGCALLAISVGRHLLEALRRWRNDPALVFAAGRPTPETPAETI